MDVPTQFDVLSLGPSVVHVLIINRRHDLPVHQPIGGSILAYFSILSTNAVVF
jgi:hypothetical protein